ncbi:MAG: GNAT family N-acetyltransferase [Leptolyngbya sp. DLM2.Bin15]|nr:MAG: GNAT family N-acetyltransferase [Leptolyngbya sp. DLM2.Bin15]
MPTGYHLRLGSGLDRAQVVKFMQRTYQELYPDRSFAHLAQTVDQYLSRDTPLWWVIADPEEGGLQDPTPVAGVWAGNAVDQTTGDRHAHIFLLYVMPEHRRCGLGRALMQQVETWSQQRGDRQVGLQVFSDNQPALRLYESLGYHCQSLWMVKPLEMPTPGS